MNLVLVIIVEKKSGFGDFLVEMKGLHLQDDGCWGFGVPGSRALASADVAKGVRLRVLVAPRNTKVPSLVQRCTKPHLFSLLRLLQQSAECCAVQGLGR